MSVGLIHLNLAAQPRIIRTLESYEDVIGRYADALFCKRPTFEVSFKRVAGGGLRSVRTTVVTDAVQMIEEGF